MNKPFIEIDAKDLIMHPFEIEKPEEYEFPEGFPYCCGSHKQHLKLLEDYHEKFPNCCDDHLEYYKKFKFDKNILYKDLPLRVLKTVSYTHHKIINSINNEDWLEDISEYLEYVIRSLGQPAVGFHYFVQFIELSINSKQTKIPTDKKKILLRIIKDQYDYTPKKEKTDMNLLYNIYEKWLDFFPFELVFFSQFKSEFSKSLPFVKEKLKSNRYLGLTSFKMVSPSELVDSLFQRTIYMLSLIDTVKLVKDELITDTEKIRLDFINQDHQYRQRILLNTFNKGEKKYIKTIKEWLENEKEYFSSIVPIINQKALPQTTKIEVTKAFKIKGLQASIKDKATDLHSSLVIKQYLNEDCKKDFIKLFSGIQLDNKISWLGKKGELKSFIDYLLSLDKIENCQSTKWLITAANFKFVNDDFKADTIKDTKKAKNDIKIKQIVQRIN